MPFVVGKQAGVPRRHRRPLRRRGPGRRRPHLHGGRRGGTGPAGRTTRWTPTVTLSLSSIDFVRLGCGRARRRRGGSRGRRRRSGRRGRRPARARRHELHVLTDGTVLASSPSEARPPPASRPGATARPVEWSARDACHRRTNGGQPRPPERRDRRARVRPGPRRRRAHAGPAGARAGLPARQGAAQGARGADGRCRRAARRGAARVAARLLRPRRRRHRARSDRAARDRHQIAARTRAPSPSTPSSRSARSSPSPATTGCR